MPTQAEAAAKKIKRPQDRGPDKTRVRNWPGPMAQKNMRIIRKLCKSPNFVPDLMALVTPKCQWWEQGNPRLLPYLGRIYVGPEGILEFFQTVGPMFKTLSLDTHSYFSRGDQVVTVVTIEAASNDRKRKLKSEVVRIYTLHQGRITKAVAYVDTAAFAKLIKGR